MVLASTTVGIEKAHELDGRKFSTAYRSSLVPIQSLLK
jgi:hypothetical protein